MRCGSITAPIGRVTAKTGWELYSRPRDRVRERESEILLAAAPSEHFLFSYSKTQLIVNFGWKNQLKTSFCSLMAL